VPATGIYADDILYLTHPFHQLYDDSNLSDNS
jgi:hypothetical protein